MILSLASACAARAADCSPASSTELDAEIARFQHLAKHHPDDAVLLYNLAADLASKCDNTATLQLLRRVAKAKGGLDPGDYRGFAFLRNTPEFQAIVAGIRHANPPRIQSQPAFVLHQPDLFPEGMAYARFNGRVYAGSVQRKIVWTDKTGELHDLVKPGEDGLAYVAGLHVDEARKTLWAVSTRFGNAPELAKAVPGLFEYDLAHDKLLAAFTGPGDSAAYLNDVTVMPSTGQAFATNTQEGSVYRTKAGSHQLEVFLPPGSIPGANGIALSEDEKNLFVAGDFGILRVNLTTKNLKAALLEHRPDVIDASLDGLYFYRQSLVGIQNAIHPGRVVRFDLDPTQTRITRAEVLETYNPLFENPTTGALDGDSLLFMANTQLHKWQPGKPSPPANVLHDIQILRLSLLSR